MLKLIFIGLLSVIVGLYATISLLRIIQTNAPDFSVYYYSAQNLWRGTNLYRESQLFTGFGYPPATLLFFLLWQSLPYQLAQAIWVVSSFILLLISVYWSMELVGLRVNLTNFLLISSLAFLSFPTRFTLGMGQVNLWVLFLLILALRLKQSHHEVWSGISLGMTFLLKPQLLLLTPLLVWTKSGKILISSLLWLGLVTVATGVFFSWEQYGSYFTTGLPPLLAFRGREIYYNQALSGIFARLRLGQSAVWWNAAASLIVVGGLAKMLSFRRQSLFVAISISLPVVLMVEPLSWQHHFVFLLPTYLLVWKNLIKSTDLVILIISYLLISVNIRYPEIFSRTPFAWLILSHVFWGNLILYYLCRKISKVVKPRKGER